ncbi:MAG: UDP-N-acetylmuramoyl-tripeptide--D-alanyl-D-alanine ligase [bacterium]|nr:UDP-N-acetylmuramoyl-tripeptide--D-alanyl-D-alanine ligase [bacterium]
MEVLSIREVVSAVGGSVISGPMEGSITDVSTNSREIKEGTLFVPIIGERVDAHKFIKGALELGASATVTSRPLNEIEVVEGKTYILVEDTLQAMQDLAAYYRSKFTIPVIGVTGSVGKTTTKEMIAAALETKFSVLKTAGNMNSQVGLPLTLFNIENSHDVAVIEMGMSIEGEMENLVKIAKPTMAVMTNIGVSHIGQLGSKENIRREKCNIINAYAEYKEGSLYVNGNDPLLHEVVEEQKGEKTIDLREETKKALAYTSVYSFGTNEDACFRATDIVFKGTETTFTYASKEEGKECKEQIKLSVLGEHNVMNACVALGVASKLGITADVAKAGLYSYQPIAMRGQIEEVNGVTLIDDSYNSSPDSMKSGLKVLFAMENKRVFAVFADVLELGEDSKKLHYQVGEFIAEEAKDGNKVDGIITIGTEAKAISDAVVDAKLDMIVKHCNNNQEAVEAIKSVMEPGDAYLIKGSRGMHTDEIVAELKK